MEPIYIEILLCKMFDVVIYIRTGSRCPENEISEP
jgi:hypothetical protein